ncbi:hypothetical protein DL95DRAFT_378272, partial [Leptodontidium sp. 2 PMI_412]
MALTGPERKRNLGIDSCFGLWELQKWFFAQCAACMYVLGLATLGTRILTFQEE